MGNGEWRGENGSAGWRTFFLPLVPKFARVKVYEFVNERLLTSHYPLSPYA